MLNTSEQSRIQNLLKQLAISEREGEIYLSCLQQGSGSVQEIARRLKCNRVSIHERVADLVKKGLLYETRKGKRRIICAEAPEVFHQLVQRKENEITSLKSSLDYVVELMGNLSVGDSSKPVVKFYEGVEGFQKMLEESIDKNPEKKVYVFTYVDIFSQIIDPDYLEDYFVRRAKKGISTQLIFPPCDFAKRVYKKSSQYKIHVKLLPSDLQWTAGFFSWHNTVALMSYTEGKMTCTLIENRDVADFVQRVIFGLCWAQAKDFS